MNSILKKGSGLSQLIIISFVSWLINVSCNNSNDSKKIKLPSALIAINI